VTAASGQPNQAIRDISTDSNNVKSKIHFVANNSNIAKHSPYLDCDNHMLCLLCQKILLSCCSSSFLVYIYILDDLACVAVSVFLLLSGMASSHLPVNLSISFTYIVEFSLIGG
jgi:hypothetical protein